ncbi:MAG: hypothetical protein A2034_03405 [Elusimicrobia bacterium GWA2_38_7]|nr:MAG: hypothetical protein A2034_03405 [Elusimicrobia bacterium GWA2_38_7]
MEKNVLWATILSAVFLMGWYYFFMPAAQAPVSIPGTTSQTNVSQEDGKNLEPAFTKTTQLLDAKQSIPIQPTERILENSKLKIALDSRGASVKHWWIKEDERITLNGKELVDLVNSGLSSSGADSFPLTTLPELQFKEVRYAKLGSGQISSVWKAELDSGLEIEKSYFLGDERGSEEESYFSKMVLVFRNLSKNPIVLENFKLGWQGGLGTTKSELKENQSVTRLLAYPSPTKEVIKFKSGKENADFTWAGIDNRYYLFAFLPKQGQLDHILTEKSKTNSGEVFLATDRLEISSGESKTYAFKLYGGPKGYTHLKELGLGLEHAVDFGYFGFLGKWALKVLNALKKTTGNYGWAIILLTCALQLLLFPLSMKSYRSTAAMKKLQPKIQELQKRYKEDAKRLNQEMLSLYKESKTNPFGGCLPMILQIPVFWAFFTMLRNSYELRGTPWIFWIKDLSQHDPYYILPVVMGGGMFLQQKLSGSVGDPTQAKVMMFMPIIFTAMFLNFPSGLVLYWLTNSILSISIQYWCTKKYA